MGWLSASIVVCAWTTATLARATLADLHCNHPQCFDVRYDGESFVHTFNVEDNVGKRHYIFIKYANWQPFEMDCGEWQALDSPALPSFSSGIRVSHIELKTCPLPTNGSLVDALATINVTLQNADGTTTLELTDLPAEPQLRASHFQGFEYVTNLWLKNSLSNIKIADLSFLPKLRNLEYLNMIGIPLPADINLPLSLRWFHLSSTAIRPLSDMLRQTANVQRLTLRSNEIVPSNAVPRVTDEQKTKSSALEELLLVQWQEQHIEQLLTCDSLKTLELSLPTVETLPNYWIAACLHLEIIDIHGAKNLHTLPPKLLEGAIALKTLIINDALQTLPDGLLKGAPNLNELDISKNNLRTLSSAMFMGPSLQVLRVGYNELENLEGMANLTSLKVLSIDHNRLGDQCDRHDYSILKNLTQLKELFLRALNITHVCKDWRENMMFLTDLHLEKTQIKELGFTDLIYTRDPSIKTVSLYLFNTPLRTVRLTEDDYKEAIANPPKTTLLLRTVYNRALKCDCDMFWTWRALQNVSTPWLELNCQDSVLLHTRPGTEVCPERFI